MRTFIIAAVAALTFSTATNAQVSRSAITQVPGSICRLANGEFAPSSYCRPPRGATGMCRDGTFVFVHNHSPTACVHRGGISSWFS